MNSYANVLLSSLLSWAEGAARWFWNVIYGGDGGLVYWVAENWLPLTIVLCAACMAVDALVHLLRWRWDLVWASFFRRMSRRGEPARKPVRVTHAQPERSAEKQAVMMTAAAPAPAQAAPVRRTRSEQPRQEAQRKSSALGVMKGVALKLLSSPMKDDNLLVHYQTPSLPVEREKAYGKPYIPPQPVRPETIPTEDEQE